MSSGDSVMNTNEKDEKLLDGLLRDFFDYFFIERISRQDLVFFLENGGYLQFDHKLNIREDRRVSMTDLYRMAVMLGMRVCDINNLIKLKKPLVHGYKPKSKAAFRNNNSAVYRRLRDIFEACGDNGFKERINRLYDEKQGEG